MTRSGFSQNLGHVVAENRIKEEILKVHFHQSNVGKVRLEPMKNTAFMPDTSLSLTSCSDLAPHAVKQNTWLKMPHLCLKHAKHTTIMCLEGSLKALLKNNAVTTD